MSRPGEPWCWRERAADARSAQARAERHGRRAEDLERRIDAGPAAPDLDQRAALHRRLERVHGDNAAQHRRAAADPRPSVAQRYHGEHGVLEAVAAGLDAAGAAIVLVDPAAVELHVAASGPFAERVQEIEFTFGVGPARDAARRGTVSARGAAIHARWPGYAAAVVALGLTSLVAAPLAAGRSTFGALVVVDSSAPARRGRAADEVALLAHAFATELLDEDPASTIAVLGGDGRVAVHQATGMLSRQLACDLDSALALLRAHAFSSDEPISAVARQVVASELRLG